MDKSGTSEAFKEAADLYGKGLYRKALPKLKKALTGPLNEESIIGVLLCVINCHNGLKEVSIAAQWVGLRS